MVRVGDTGVVERECDWVRSARGEVRVSKSGGDDMAGLDMLGATGEVR